MAAASVLVEAPSTPPPFSLEPEANLAWNRALWGDKATWVDTHRYGYKWFDGMQQENCGPSVLVEKFLLPHLHGQRGLRSMEIGCGAGRLAAELIRLSHVTHLIDINPVCVQMCRDRFRYYPIVHCFQNDGRTIAEFGPNEYDLIAAHDTMIHVAPEIVEGYIEGAVEKLKPGGIIWFDNTQHGPDPERCRAGLSSAEVAAIANRLGLTVEAQYPQSGQDCISVLRKGTPRAVATTQSDEHFRSKIRQVDTELDRALRGASEWNRSRIPHLRGTFIKILRELQLPDAASGAAPILEIGADGQLASAKVLASLTGLEVVATNLIVDGYESRVGDYNITVRQNGIDGLDFPDESFSMIFGRSVLEHISGLPNFIEECYRVLRPGGVMFIDGGAFYYSPSGHHMAVKGVTGTHYGFDVMPDLIPPWFHLLTNAEGMRDFLRDERDVPAEDAEIIGNYIFDSPEQNRLSGRDIIRCFQDGLFRSVKYDCTFVDADPPVELLGSHSRFDLKCHGISFCVTK